MPVFGTALSKSDPRSSHFTVPARRTPEGLPRAREPSWITPKRDLQTSGEQGPARATLLPCKGSGWATAATRE